MLRRFAVLNDDGQTICLTGNQIRKMKKPPKIVTELIFKIKTEIDGFVESTLWFGKDSYLYSVYSDKSVSKLNKIAKIN